MATKRKKKAPQSLREIAEYYINIGDPKAELCVTAEELVALFEKAEQADRWATRVKELELRATMATNLLSGKRALPLLT